MPGKKKSFKDIFKLAGKRFSNNEDKLVANMDNLPEDFDYPSASEAKEIIKGLKSQETDEFWNKRMREIHKMIDRSSDKDEIKRLKTKLKAYSEMRKQEES